MNVSDERTAYEELKDRINFHNYRYHVLDDPVISDYEFDQLLLKLRNIEDLHPEWISADSPTQRSGAPPADGFEKVPHPDRILSLANAFSIDDLHSWFDRVSKLDERIRDAEFVLEPKIDGLTVVLHYQSGIFTQGATRGNGEVGEDITQNIRTVASVPLKIPVDNESVEVPESLVVRAEAFITQADFKRLNAEFTAKREKTYQNPRNTAAGSLRLLDSSIVAKRPLRIIAYSIVAGNPKDSQWETINYLKALGFPVPQISEKCLSFNEMISSLEKWGQYRESLNYEIDGIVIKINNLQMADDLGFVGKDPRGAIALKFPAQEVTTQLMEIRVNVGRTGILTPYAILDPVEIGGVVVKQATLHNFDFIADKDIRVGDRVLVKRAGEVIPYVIGPITDVRDGSEKEYIPPRACPTCGMEVETIPGEVAWYCVNNACPAQIIRAIEHFVSRSCMDIVGLGINIVEQLVQEGLIKDVADLYALQKKNLLKLDGFAEKKADNLLHAIEESKNRSLAKLIAALGIQGIGEVAADDLAARYSDLESLSKANADDIEKIDGFGPNTVEALQKWFSQKRNIEIINKLCLNGVWPTSRVDKSAASQTFAGLRFVITGTLKEFSRDAIKGFIKGHGGKVSDSVSAKTNYLVLGENPGSKLEKAQTLGVKIITERELKALAGAGQ